MTIKKLNHELPMKKKSGLFMLLSVVSAEWLDVSVFIYSDMPR